MAATAYTPRTGPQYRPLGETPNNTPATNWIDPGTSAPNSVTGTIISSLNKGYAAAHPDPMADPSVRALQNLIHKDTTNAENLQNSANQFGSELSGYTGKQVFAATDAAKQGLANDIQGVKAGSNARGLLNSGINTENQNMARASRSTDLAKSIQDINTNADTQLQNKQQLATDAYNQVNSEQVQYNTLLGNMKADAYKQALAEQQNQNAYYESLMKGAAEIGVAALMLL